MSETKGNKKLKSILVSNVPVDIHRRLKLLAVDSELTLSDFVLITVQYFMLETANSTTFKEDIKNIHEYIKKQRGNNKHV